MIRSCNSSKSKKLSSKLRFINPGILTNLKYDEAIFSIISSKYTSVEFHISLFLGVKYLVYYLELFSIDQSKLIESSISNHLKGILAFLYKCKKRKFEPFLKIILTIQKLFIRINNTVKEEWDLQQKRWDELLMNCKNAIFCTNNLISSDKLSLLLNFGYTTNKTSIVRLTYLINNKNEYFNPLINLRKGSLENIANKCFCKISMNSVDFNTIEFRSYVYIEVIFDVYRGKLSGFLEMLGYLIKCFNPKLSLPNAEKVVFLYNSSVYNCLSNVSHKELMRIGYFTESSFHMKDFIDKLHITKTFYSVVEAINLEKNEIHKNLKLRKESKTSVKHLKDIINGDDLVSESSAVVPMKSYEREIVTVQNNKQRLTVPPWNTDKDYNEMNKELNEQKLTSNNLTKNSSNSRKIDTVENIFVTSVSTDYSEVPQDKLKNMLDKIIFAKKFKYNNDGMLNHKVRLFMRCETEEIADDEKNPYVFESKSIRSRLAGTATYQKSIETKWFRHKKSFKKYDTRAAFNNRLSDLHIKAAKNYSVSVLPSKAFLSRNFNPSKRIESIVKMIDDGVRQGGKISAMFIDGREVFNDGKGNYFDSDGRFIGKGVYNDGKGNYYDNTGKFIGKGNGSDGRRIFLYGKEVFCDGKDNFYDFNGKFIGARLYADGIGNIYNGKSSLVGKGHIFEAITLNIDGKEILHDGKGNYYDENEVFIGKGLSKDNKECYYDSSGKFIGYETKPEVKRMFIDNIELFNNGKGSFYDKSGNLFGIGLHEDGNGNFYDNQGNFVGKGNFIQGKSININGKEVYNDGKDNYYDTEGNFIGTGLIKDIKGNYNDIFGNFIGKERKPGSIKIIVNGVELFSDDNNNYYDCQGKLIGSGLGVDENGNVHDNKGKFVGKGFTSVRSSIYIDGKEIFEDSKGNFFNESGVILGKDITNDGKGNYFDANGKYIGLSLKPGEKCIFLNGVKVFHNGTGKYYDEDGNFVGVGLHDNGKGEFCDKDEAYIGKGNYYDSKGVYFDEHGDFFDIRGNKLVANEISDDGQGNYFTKDGTFLGQASLIDAKELKKLIELNKFNSFDENNNPMLSDYMKRFQESTITNILSGSRKYTIFWDEIILEMTEFQPLLKDTKQILCNPGDLIQSFMDNNKETLDKIKKNQSVSAGNIFIVISLITLGAITPEEFSYITDGKGQELAAINRINRMPLSNPCKLGYLSTRTSESHATDYDDSYSIVICQIVYDIILLNIHRTSSIVFIFNQHSENLKRLVEESNYKIQKVFYKLRILKRLRHLKFDDFIKNNKTDIKEMLEDLNAIHELFFYQPCCTYQTLSHVGIRVLYSSLIIPQKVNVIEPFLRLNGDRRLKKIENKGHCAVALRTVSHKFISVEDYVIDIFYEFQLGNYFGVIDMINNDLLKNSVKLNLHRSLIVFPTGELWVFHDLDWLKHTTSLMQAKEKVYDFPLMSDSDETQNKEVKN